jgi:hypothetical protein
MNVLNGNSRFTTAQPSNFRWVPPGESTPSQPTPGQPVDTVSLNDFQKEMAEIKRMNELRLKWRDRVNEKCPAPPEVKTTAEDWGKEMNFQACANQQLQELKFEESLRGF